TFVMLETLEDLVEAARARGATFSEFWSNRRLYARIMGMTMLRAIERSERLVVSMRARGYEGDLRLERAIPQPPIHEIAVVVGAYLVVLGYSAVVRGVVL
ncbi:MAG: CbiQ family ECF transporter T component, partial [Halodesulfurarchaeum sp.]